MNIDKFEYKAQKDKIISLIGELIDDDIIPGVSFNFGYYKRNYDSIEEEYIKKTKELLSKNGIDLDKFFSQFKKQIYKDWQFTAVNAFYDSLLYYYDNKNGLLGGYKLSESEDKEYFIKYSYGYFNYDMGKKFILQSFNNLEDYYKETAERFLKGMSDKKDIIPRDKLDLCSITKKYDNCYTIYVNLKYAYTFFDFSGPYKNYNYDRFIIEIKKDLGNTNYRIFDHILSIFIGCRNNKISLKEFDEIKDELNMRYEASKFNL